jgi:TonB family protein
MLRTAAIVALLTAATLSAQTYEKRSAHHHLKVEVLPGSGDDVDYHVVVTDDAAKVLLDTQLHAKRGEQAESVKATGDSEVHVRVSSTRSRVSASAQFTGGGELEDFVSGVWPEGPQRLEAAGLYRVGNGVKAPVVVTRAEPMYTEEARRARISGIVIVECHIDATGIVRDAIILKDLPFGLGDAALAAVKQWEFEPGTLDGQPVDVLFNLTVNFKLDAPKPPPAQ